MCTTLAPEVEKLICAGNIYTKKKAALAATRIVRRDKTLAKTFAQSVKYLIKERNHGVFLAALGLMQEILRADIK
jgi:AP-1 complex subunit gamma-1